jgi:K+-transporting ATPase ATPase C chain
MWIALRAVLLFTVLLGVVYPLVMTGLAQVGAPYQANGSPVSLNGQVVGSALLGQGFVDADGHPLSQYFQSRPSAVNWNGGESGASNLGPESTKLIDDITARRAQIAAFNGVSEADVPVDALTASGSGLDPDISPAYAELQVARVAAARGVSVAEVEALVVANTSGPDLGYIGNARVNVLTLNVALDRQFG